MTRLAKPGRIVHAHSRRVEPGKPKRIANAATNTGMMTAARTRVARSRPSSPWRVVADSSVTGHNGTPWAAWTLYRPNNTIGPDQRNDVTCGLAVGAVRVACPGVGAGPNKPAANRIVSP